MPAVANTGIYLKPVSYKTFNTSPTKAPAAPKAPAASTLPPGVTQQMIDASKAANPEASTGAYGVDSSGKAIPSVAPQVDTLTALQQAGGSPNPGDYSYDSTLQGIINAQEGIITKAQADELAQERQSLLGFGSLSLAQSLLGPDDPTLAAITDNPDTGTSTLSKLNRSYRTQQVGLENDLNNQNLWYGGWHGKEVGDLLQNKQQDIADATAQEQQQLASLQAALLQTIQQARANEANAELAAALAAAGRVGGSSGGGGGGDGGGGGGDTTPAAASAPRATVGAGVQTSPGGIVADATGGYYDPTTGQYYTAGKGPASAAAKAIASIAKSRPGGTSGNAQQGVYATH